MEPLDEQGNVIREMPEDDYDSRADAYLGYDIDADMSQ